MKIPREETNEEVFLNLTAFIDMMLVLVIFFLATSRFTEDERDESIRLARSGSTLPIPTLSDVLVINIDREGQRKIDGTFRTLEEVEAIIRERKAAREDLEVVVRADDRGLIRGEREVLEICYRLGLKTPHVAYETLTDG